MKKKINKLTKDTKTRFKTYASKIFEIIMKPEMGVLPGQMAFSMLLSIVPILTILGFGVSVIGYDLDSIINLIDDLVPGVASYITPYVVGASIDISFVIIIIWMFWLATKGCNSIIIISNRIYGIDKSHLVRRRIKSLFMTIAIMIMFLLLLVIRVFGSRIISLLSFTPFINQIIVVYQIFKGPLMWLILFIFLRAFYEVAPDRVRKKTHINTGAFFTSIGWVVITNIYTYATPSIDKYNLYYGALSNIAFLLIWLYYMSYIFVIGLSLNYGAEKEEETKEKTGAVKVVSNR